MVTTRSRTDSESLCILPRKQGFKYFRCFLSGLFVNVAMQQHDGSYRTLRNSQQVFIHPSSALFGRKPRCVLFNELVQTKKCYMRDCCVLDQVC